MVAQARHDAVLGATSVRTRRKPEANKEEDLQKLMEASLLAAEARKAFMSDNAKEALGKCQKALEIVPGEMQAATVCALAACRAKDDALVKRFFAMLPQSRKRTVAQVKACMEHGVVVEDPVKQEPPGVTKATRSSGNQASANTGKTQSASGTSTTDSAGSAGR